MSSIELLQEQIVSCACLADYVKDYNDKYPPKEVITAYLSLTIGTLIQGPVAGIEAVLALASMFRMVYQAGYKDGKADGAIFRRG